MSLFVTFEGPEGCGKSTQARELYEQLRGRGYRVILTREPGGTRIGDMVRRILLDFRNTEMAAATETLLFSAARAQLVAEVIRPYLAYGGIVLCDRYADSTFAYQGYGLGRDLDELRAITQAATGGLKPDLTLYLDLPAEIGLERKHLARERHEGQRPPLAPVAGLPAPRGTRSEHVEWNRLDARELAFHKRVEQGYGELIAREPQRWRTVDAQQPIEAIAAEIFAIVEPLLEQIQVAEPQPEQPR
jgi:dTMP kinase